MQFCWDSSPTTSKERMRRHQTLLPRPRVRQLGLLNPPPRLRRLSPSRLLRRQRRLSDLRRFLLHVACGFSSARCVRKGRPRLQHRGRSLWRLRLPRFRPDSGEVEPFHCSAHPQVSSPSHPRSSSRCHPREGGDRVTPAMLRSIGSALEFSPAKAGAGTTGSCDSMRTKCALDRIPVMRLYDASNILCLAFGPRPNRFLSSRPASSARGRHAATKR